MSTYRSQMKEVALRRLRSQERRCLRERRPWSGYWGVHKWQNKWRSCMYREGKVVMSYYSENPRKCAVWYDNHILNYKSDSITNKELGLL